MRGELTVHKKSTEPSITVDHQLRHTRPHGTREQCASSALFRGASRGEEFAEKPLLQPRADGGDAEGVPPQELRDVQAVHAQRRRATLKFDEWSSTYNRASQYVRTYYL